MMLDLEPGDAAQVDFGAGCHGRCQTAR
jgi:hypothetical protein